MRFTNVLRNYTEEQLRAKANDKIKLFSAAYESDKQNVMDQVEAIIEEARQKALKVILENGFEVKDRFGKRDMENVIPFNDYYIGDLAREEAINNFRNEVNANIRTAIKDIELECALGADKAAFLQMLDEAVI